MQDTQVSNGPTVVWNLLAEPLPEIPLPNDAATRIDPTSPTGRRVNISLMADTQFERRMRAGFNTLDGFGTFSAITVQFDATLDLKDLWARHNGGPWPEGGQYRDDFRDDAVFVLNVDRSCSRFGEEVAIDIGRGRYPVVLDKHGRKDLDDKAPDGYRLEGGNVAFEFDPHALANNLLFEERNEDINSNSVLDDGEDTDFDGHLDQPNLMDLDACASLSAGTLEYDRCMVDNLMTFYDRQNNTLILRPVWPLEDRCTHAVVLTTRLKGEDGHAVQSPFPGVSPATHVPALQPIAELLPRYDLSLQDVAFAWTFTTGSMTQELEALRKGLYGAGPFHRLADEFPVSSLSLYEPEDDVSTDALFPGGCGGLTLSKVWEEVIGEWVPNLCGIDSDFVSTGGIFHGSFKAPNLMVNKEGLATPGYAMDSNESWVLDVKNGTAQYGDSDVTFWCSLPRDPETAITCEEGNPDGVPFCKPYPVIFYAHGYTGSRAGQHSTMGRATAMGFAACAMDAYGHGGNRERLSFPNGVLYTKFKGYGAQEMETLMLRGRDRDLNNDGLPDPGGDFWTNDVFHTRDMLRQTALEWMQFVRIVRSFDGVHKDAKGRLLGDPDNDGVVDLGGPKTRLGMWGISLGGILAGILKGAEPSLDAVSPNAGGAGLTDIGARSIQAGVPEAVILPIIGPLVLGSIETDAHQNPIPDAPMRLYYRVNNVGQDQTVDFATVEGTQAGDRVLLENLDKPHKTAQGQITARGTLRLAVAADAMGALDRRRLFGLDDDHTTPVVYEDTPRLADRFRLTFYKGDTMEVRTVVDRFGVDATFQGTTHPKDAPLVALQEGLGYHRNSPEFRRFLSIAQHALDPADPAIWSAKVAVDPIDATYDPHWTEAWKGGHTRVLYMPTVGDPQVPVNTGIAEARIGGLLGSWERDTTIAPEYGWRALFVPDERFGHSKEHELVVRYVNEGVDRLERFHETHPDLPHQRVLYDIENIADGQASWSCIQEQTAAGDWDSHKCPQALKDAQGSFTVPTAAPGHGLRLQQERQVGRYDALRIPLIRPTGQHGIYNPQPFRAFDTDTHMVNYTLRFLGTGGRRAEHVEGCDCSASAIAAWTLNGDPTLGLSGESGACGAADFKICTPECAEAWGIHSFATPNECTVP